jgi:hypothetical protein
MVVSGPVSRVLVCNDCEEYVELFEEPVEFTDPLRFVCVRCLDDRHAADRTADLRTGPQLSLAPDAPRQERTKYNPAQARIPY